MTETLTVLELAQLLGSLGEFFGAIAVVATLAYLAVQVRHTRSLVLSQVHQSSFALQADYLKALGGSAEAARVVAEGRRGMGNLSEAEQVQFSGLMSLGLNVIEHSVRHPGHRDEVQDDDLQSLVLYFLDNPGGQEYWASFRKLYTGEFVDWVDGVLGTRAKAIDA